LLPHGEQARFITHVETISGNRVHALCDPLLAAHLQPEWTIEAMAQTAAVFLAHTRAKSSQRRSGMLVVVQQCRLQSPAKQLDLPIICEVESLNDATEGLLLFKGTCHDEGDTLLAEATFTIFIPPMEEIQTDG
jgi:predicted hotdog family 3-hydroxylacyl-ACP dehydratase